MQKLIVREATLTSALYGLLELDESVPPRVPEVKSDMMQEQCLLVESGICRKTTTCRRRNCRLRWDRSGILEGVGRYRGTSLKLLRSQLGSLSRKHCS